MGQGKEPGPWEEMGLGSLPRVTRENLNRSIKGQLSVCVLGRGGGRAPESWPPSAVPPPPPYLLTSPVKWDGPPPRELED